MNIVKIAAVVGLLLSTPAYAVPGELAAAKANMLALAKKDLFDRKGQVILGADKPSKTIAVFLDYRCGYCKRANVTLLKALKEANATAIVHQVAVLGEESRMAASLALAAVDLGKGPEAHNALMEHTGDWSLASLAATVSKATGIPADKLQTGAAAVSVKERMAHAVELAEAIGFQGTPTFISNKETIPGAPSEERLRQFLKNAGG